MNVAVATKEMIKLSANRIERTHADGLFELKVDATEHYRKLATSFYWYANDFPDHQASVRTVIEDMTGLLRAAAPGQVKRIVNSYCKLLETRTHPVLIDAAFRCFASAVGSVRLSDLTGVLMTRIKNTLFQAQKDVDFSAVIDAPVDILIEMLQYRFDEEFEEMGL